MQRRGVRRLEEDAHHERAKILPAAAEYLEAKPTSSRASSRARRASSLALAKGYPGSAQTLRFYAVEGQSFSGDLSQDDPDIEKSQRERRATSRRGISVSIPARKIAPALITAIRSSSKPSSDRR